MRYSLLNDDTDDPIRDTSTQIFCILDRPTEPAEASRVDSRSQTNLEEYMYHRRKDDGDEGVAHSNSESNIC